MSRITDHQSPSEIEITISATVDHVDRAVVSVKKTLAAKFSNYDDFSLELILRETLMNAVKHGSGYDAKKKIFLKLSWDDQYFYIQIRDEGQGFSYTPGIPKKAIPDSESGRGLPIIEYYAKQIRFNETGNEVKIKTRISKREPNA
ncbi:MAG: ATP-binding protein [Candidatus Marinimicrobia bacterium]|nr:ATP-binding protein [Candidatus Neomarinimicrobiota bacterium]